MQRPVAAADERQVDVLEVRQQLADLLVREHAQVRRVLLRRLSEKEAQAALDVERVRDGADEVPARLQHPKHLGDERLGEAQMLEQLAGDDGVEGLVGERERLLHVGHDRRDPALLRLGEGGPVDVDADDLVPVDEVLAQRAGAAAQVEHLVALADRLLEERDALGDEHELAVVPALPVVALVDLAERHG